MGKILQWAMKNDPPLANEIKLLLLRNRQTTTTSVGGKDSTAATTVEPTTTTARADSVCADQSTPRQQTKRLVDFMEIPEPVLARELTIIEWQLFQEVNVRSLLTTTKTQPGGDSLFEPIITQYKLVSHWVATEILVTKSATVQVQVLEKFIRLAAQFLQLNNFNSFMEIVSGPHRSHSFFVVFANVCGVVCDVVCACACAVCGVCLVTQGSTTTRCRG
jgi:hypothetical protein